LYPYRFYHFDTSQFGWGFNTLFALSTQCLGFGLAGSVRKFLVEPAAMIWPGALVNVGFMYALHDHSRADPSTTNGWSVSRYKWFMIMMAVMFVWSWFPDFIIPAFSYFAWVTWAKPNNVIVNQLFGQQTGVSLGFPFTGFTLDWAQINSFYNSPLLAPWHALANTGVGIVFFGWLVVPALQYSNVWYGEYLPISQNGIFDNTGASYNISRILTPEHIVDPAKYEAYSPLMLSTAFALTYGMSFATIAALVSHTYLFHGPEIWRRLKSSKGELDDVHMKIMRKYRLVPTWWYLALLAIMTAFAFVSALAYPTGMAWYSVLLSLIIATIFTIPIGMIQAFTNIQLGLNVFTEFIIGYIQPGHPIAMMMFKTFGYIVMTQALYFCQDLKLGHYMHVPQRTMFMAQLVATVWSCLCQLATVEWAMGTIKNVCTKAAQGNFTCASIKTFYNASVIWGAIGPKHIFSSGAVYTSLQYFWVAGFLAPFVVYGLARAFPKVSLIRKVSMPLIFACFSYVPPYSAMNIVSYSNSSADINLCANFYDSFLGSWSVGLSTNSSVTSTVDGGWSTTTSPLLLGTLVLLSAPSSSSSVFSFPATACLITGELLLSATLWMVLAVPLTPERWLPMARSLVQPREHGSGNLGRDRFFQTDIWRQQLGDFGRTRYPVFSLYVYIIFDNSMSFSS
jgi:OPT family small oligopeptide transporter